MFDSAPPNLPVEPAPKASFQPPQMPSAPAAPPTPPIAQQPVVMGAARKEPEDIFKGLDAASDVSGNAVMPEFESAPRKSPIKLIGMIVGGLVVLGAIGFAAWYFLIKPKAAVEEVVVAPTVTQTPTEQVETPPPTQQTPVTTPPPGANIPAPQPVSQPSQSPTSTEASPASVVPTSPSVTETATTSVGTPVAGADIDQDGLTNAEEALLGTNPALADTNANGYPDGTEVNNMYDPAKKGAPLAESSRLKWLEWEGIRFLVPISWSLLTDPLRSGMAVVDTATAAKFTLQKRTDLGNLSLRGWLALPDNDTSMIALKPKAGWEAMQTADGLTTYVAVNGTIIIMAYEPNGAPAYEFRSLFRLMADSLQTVK